MSNDLKNLFRSHFKVFIVQTLMQFEGINLSINETQKILDHNKIYQDINDEQALVINNLLGTLDFVDSLEHSQAIDKNLYILLNSKIAQKQALSVGTFRDGATSIPCIDHPIPPPNEIIIEQYLKRLNLLNANNFKHEVSEVFCELSKLQPFWDGNKRSTLFLCNVALIQKNLGLFYITEHQYSTFDKKLTDFYTNQDHSLVSWLENHCVRSKTELSHKIENT